ncbi:ATP-binding protein [Mucisphaera calidilacus]|uniref:Serine-protein kinase RsbW n=1 Tax=Mucisphaera calidilacus TaxID=2527982 RepID=A0A518BZA4_9BACT|nr:ATP-binding protein [Mucisphaera calidilacus]QDU72299.1 Serine-protein kinase RsbW [Mucisphaera calidilacus]
MGESRKPTSETLTIPSDLEEVAPVQEHIVQAAQQHGYPDDAIFAIKLCLDESITNAIRHGNKRDPRLRVTIRYTIDEHRIEITVCDQGQGFNPHDVPDPTLEENLVRPCGRGVMLMAAYMTSVSYNDAGNCVTMTRAREHKND